MHVVKVGGSILKDENDLSMIKNKISNCHNCIIVTSALKNVTNMLIKATETKNTEIIDNIYNMHINIAKNYLDNNSIKILKKFRNELYTLVSMDNNVLLRDRILSYGEKMSTLVLYNFFKNNLDVSYILEPFIVTDNNFGDANFIYDYTEKNLLKLKFNDFTIVPGFTGKTINGEITTLGRGGSDYTAMIIASILNSNVRIITDVPGIMTSDPKIFKNSKTLKEVSIKEALKMSYFGVKNFNYKTFTPVMDKNIDITIESLYESGKTVITRNEINTLKCVVLANKNIMNLLVFIGHGISENNISDNITNYIGKNHLYYKDDLSLSVVLDDDIINNKKCFEVASSWIK